jgi:hypothetical protein
MHNTHLLRTRSSVSGLYFELEKHSTVLKMAFILRRAFSTTSRRLYYQAMKPSIANPAPVGAGAVLESPDLQQLAQKAQGPWKELTNEEVVQRKLYY